MLYKSISKTMATASFRPAAFLLVYLVSTQTAKVLKRELAQAPANQVALVDKDVSLSCGTTLNDPVAWYFTPVGSNKGREIFNGQSIIERLREKYQVETNAKGQYTLTIKNVQLEDAGKYECQDDVGFGEKRFAELTVEHYNYSEINGTLSCEFKAKSNLKFEINCLGSHDEPLIRPNTKTHFYNSVRIGNVYFWSEVVIHDSSSNSKHKRSVGDSTCKHIPKPDADGTTTTHQSEITSTNPPVTNSIVSGNGAVPTTNSSILLLAILIPLAIVICLVIGLAVFWSKRKKLTKFRETGFLFKQPNREERQPTGQELKPMIVIEDSAENKTEKI